MFSLIKKILTSRFSLQNYPVSFLIIGIGNKGQKYDNTRHNIGFSIIDKILDNCTDIKNFNRFETELFLHRLPKNEFILFAKPQTYVNRTGKPFKALQNKYQLPLSSCLVVFDDFHLPLGTLRFKRRGSDGGHNGLKSIISEVGREFPRLKIGIGPLPKGVNIIDFVLGTFTNSEKKVINHTIKKASDAIQYFCDNGINEAMNKFNNN